MSTMPRLLTLPVCSAFFAFLALPTGAQTFPDIADVNTAACSDNYSRVHDCYNVELPDPPSLERSLSAFGDDDEHVVTMPEGPARDGATHVLPNVRTSNDGRLLLMPAGARPGFTVFRPETLGYDLEQRGSDQTFGHGAYSAKRTVFPATLFDPRRTLFDLDQSSWPAIYHDSICDDSSTAYDLGSSISSGRNPRACSALVALSGNPLDAANAQLVDGDCYDVSILANASKDEMWELITNKFTVFVPRAKEPDAGEPKVYIYPRMSGNQLPFHGDYSAFNFHWTGTTWDWSWQFELQKLRQECVDKPSWQRPAYCGFQNTLETSATNGFVMDQDGDGQIDSGERWSGKRCSAQNPGSDCGNWFLFEPSITADGRLLVVNAAGIGLYYSYSENACSANGWRFFRPLSAMPFDSRLKGRYPIAAQPFRTSTGEPILRQSNGKYPNVRGAYPWIDRQGRNLFYSPINDARDGYEALDVTEPCPPGTPWYKCEYDASYAGTYQVPDEGPGKGTSVIGAWTRGKLVHLDGRLNFTTFGNLRANNANVNHNKKSSWEIQLYNGPPTFMEPMGTTRLQSAENLYNAYDALRPTQPFDVVWSVAANNQQTQEVVFDEFMNSNAFIVAPMNAPFTTFGSRQEIFLDDGFVPRNPEKSVRFNGPGTADFGFRRSPKLQNQSTLEAGVCTAGSPGPGGTCRLVTWGENNRTYTWLSWSHRIRVRVPGAWPLWFVNYCPSGTQRVSNSTSGWDRIQECRVNLPSGVSGGDAFISGNALAFQAAPLNPFELTPPTYLSVRGGARVEPVALGGVIGNGLWLDGKNDHIAASYPAPPVHDWYVGMWLDPRPSDNQRRTLFTFADGSRVMWRPNELSAWHAPSGQTKARGLANIGLEGTEGQPGEYFHLGLHISTSGSNRVLRISIDGTRLPGALSFQTTASNPGFDMSRPGQSQGAFWVGDFGGGSGARPPFRGWIDELRVYALGPAERAPSSWFDETACNLALGTLVRVQSNDGSAASQGLRELWARANDFGLLGKTAVGKRASQPAGQQITSARVCEQLRFRQGWAGPTDLPPQNEERVCVDRVHRNQRPGLEARCLRRSVLGVAGRDLVADQPRPEFGDLPFCQSCHTDFATFDGLAPEALDAGAVPRYRDDRRQPLDWPAVLTGCHPTSHPFPAGGDCSGGSEYLDFIFDEGPKVEPEP